MKAHLNPFAPDRVQRLLPFDPELSSTSWEALDDRWLKLNYQAAVTGPHGSGKTTFLDTFSERLARTFSVERLFLHRNECRLSSAQREQITQLKDPANTILVVDGEGHLTWRDRRWLRRQSQKMAGYLVARHHRCSLPTLLSLKPTPQLAHQLLQQIHPAEAVQRENDLPLLLRKKSGNLRELWLSFYDDYSSLPAARSRFGDKAGGKG